MRVALDTNILAYAEGVNGGARKKAALAIVERLPSEETFVPVQVLGELYAVLVRKAERAPARARDAILSWQETFTSIETSSGVLAAAIDLAAGHNLGIWDSIILSASAAGASRFLLSEDLQNGFTWNGVTVLNPFEAGVLERVLGE
jgi:predicted nucleic acid-binding protein